MKTEIVSFCTVYTVFVPHFCSAPSSSPLCVCHDHSIPHPASGCAKPMVIRNNVKDGEWLSSAKLTKPDGSKWSSYYKLSKSGGEWHYEKKYDGRFRLGNEKGKPAKKAKKKLLTCPDGSYLGASGNCISKTKCADGSYCVVGHIGDEIKET